MAWSSTVALSSGPVSSRVYTDLFCAEVAKNPDGVLARLSAPLDADQLREHLEARNEADGRHVSFYAIEDWDEVAQDGSGVTTWVETAGMYAEARSHSSQRAVRHDQQALQGALDELLASAADPKHGGPRSLTVVRKKLSVEREKAVAAIYNEPTITPGIEVRTSELRRVLSTGGGPIGLVRVGTDTPEGAVVEAQVVLARGATTDGTASPEQVEAIVNAVTQWAAGRTISGKRMQLRTAPLPPTDAPGAWLK